MFSLEFWKYNEPVKIEVELCKRNFKRTKLGYLHCYNKKMTKRFGNIDEFEFMVDMYNERNGVLEKNPYYDMVDGKAILKITILNESKYFVIKDCSEIQDDNKRATKQIVAYSYEYTFSEKIIRSMKDVYKLYDTTNVTKSILHEVIRLNPLWKIGYISPDVNKYRIMNVEEQSLLDFIYDLQKTFGCYIEFNTVSRTINVHKLEDVGRNRGLVLNERNYVNSLEIKPNFDDVVTRLWVYGKDNASINKFTTGGQSYIEMYDYYMNNPNIVDQDLVVAYNTYQELLKRKQGEFNNFLNQLSVKFNEMSTLNNELAKLNSDLKKIQDQIDVAINGLTTDGVIEVNLTSLKNQEKAKQTEIDNKKNQVNTKQKEIDAINTQIENLRKTIAGEANFTEEQLMGLNEITFEKVFRDTNIEDEEELYNKAVEELPKLAQPKISFEVNLLNFLKALEHQINWDKVLFGLGDFVNIENEIFPKPIAVRLIELSFMEDGLDFDMKFSNKSSLDDPMVFFEELGKKVNSSSIILDINKFIYGKYEEERSDLQDYINGQLDLSAQEAIAGKNQEVIINDRGITLTNRNDTNKQLKLLSSLIAFTDDGFNTVKSSIKNGYIVADYLIGKVLIGTELVIQNSNNSFHVDQSGATLVDADFLLTTKDRKSRLILNSTDGIKMQGLVDGEYVDKFFLDSNGNANFSGTVSASEINGSTITGGLLQIGKNRNNGYNLVVDDSRFIINNADFTMQKKNSSGTVISQVSMSPTTGFAISKNNNNTLEKVFWADANGNLNITNADFSIDKKDSYGNIINRVSMSPTDGFAISKKNGSRLDKVFWVDTNGNINLNGNITMTGGSISWENVGNNFATKTELSNSIANVNNSITNVSNTSSAYFNDLTTMINNLEKIPTYITSTKITKTTIESPTITAGTLNSVEINSARINSATINIRDDVNLGANLNLRANENSKAGSIVMSGCGDITFNDQYGIMRISARQQIDLSCSLITINGKELEMNVAVFG